MRIATVAVLCCVLVAAYATSLGDTEILARALDILQKREVSECSNRVTQGITASFVNSDTGNTRITLASTSPILDMTASGCEIMLDNDDTTDILRIDLDSAVTVQEVRFRARFGSLYKVKLNGKLYDKISADASDQENQDLSTNAGSKANVNKIEIIPTSPSGEVVMKKVQICT